ncbi:xylose isomerase [Fimbriiglobus ruber]|uniref:Xylose isomerase n=1 Tax=Fimbriiglobus ruber TaxID=1908690 RepID=A0A225EEN4_9BACT|nr:xylose isomerase [Fimbriiglobus ruber]
MGVNGVQIDAVGDLSPDKLTETGRREFRTLLRSYNLELTALNCPLRRGLDLAENLQPRIDHLRKVMQLAFDLGARKIVAPLPKLPGPEESQSPRATTARESITALGQYGDRVGTLVALEPGLDPGDKVRDYLNSFDIGSLAINFDPANLLLNGFDPLAGLTALAGKIVHTHARDGRTASPAGGPREVAVGSGDIDWLLYIATLESIEYRGYLTVDREASEHRFADVTAGVRFLRRFVGEQG